MKNRFTTILIFLMSTIFASAQNYDSVFVDKMAFQKINNYMLKSVFQESENFGLYDLIYQRMEWQVNPENRYIRGKVTSYFKSETNNLTEIEFDLNNALIIDSITQNGQNIDFVHANDKVVIPLNRTLESQQTDSVSIFYLGEPAVTGFGSFTRSEHNGVPIIWTLSEPFGAVDWWSCKQSLSDKIDSIDIIVKTPELYRTASNGILVSETVDNKYRTMHWKHRFPIATYLVAIAVTNYVEYSEYVELEDGNQIEILNYVYPEYLVSAKMNSGVTVQIMELFNEKIGIYPFAKEKYGHAQFGWGGGMEHQTMSFMGSFNFNLIAHELAHQWFGDYITLGTWQDIWLNEGFATYLTGLTYENLRSKQDWENWKRNNIAYIVSNPGGSVFVSDTTSVSRIFSGRLSYTKGAHLLHMLRWILGDEAFFSGLQNYFNDPDIANNFAQNYQFVQHMESAGDTSLTEFFNDWYYGEGFPVYSINYIQENPETVKIQLTQTPSHESVEFFEMPVPVRIYNFDKTDSADFKLIHTRDDQEFILSVNFEVGEIVIDPEYWLITKVSEIVSSLSLGKSNNIQVYPNPFDDKISISINNQQLPFNVNIFTTGGKLIKQFESVKNPLDLSEFSNGIYILQIKYLEEIYEQKIIKQ